MRPPSAVSSVRLAFTTLLALAGFAANSILCRLALVEPALDPASFSAIRLVSGGLLLAGLVVWKKRARALRSPNLKGTLWLVGYAIPFSYAYVELDAGAGALVLFGAVQLCMLVAALLSGERLSPKRWLGFAAAVAGLVYLISPGVSAPPALSATVMAFAGVSWGLYSLHGRNSKNPTENTATNFLWATPVALLLCLAELPELHASGYGIGLGIASGALASGVGYALWYAALPKLSRARAAILQLSVPVLASAYGVLFMAEALTERLVVSTALILGGVGLTLLKDSAKKVKEPKPAEL